jgi:hypothetical protein
MVCAEKALAAGKQWLTKAEYDAMSTNGASLFGDVKDFTFFPGTEQDMLWGSATSTEHQLSIQVLQKNLVTNFPRLFERWKFVASRK